MSTDFTPSYTNLVKLLQGSIRNYANNELFGVQKDGHWRWTTYREFGELVGLFRSGLVSIGVEKADRVAIISNNRLEWIVAAHACYSLPATYVPMYESQVDSEWKYILADCGAKVCIVANHAVAARVEALRSELPNLKVIINLEGEAEDPHSYRSLMAHGKRTPHEGVIPDDSEIATLVYTSGTTGNPKGVMLSHFGLASTLCGAMEVVKPRATDRTLAFLPWAHAFGGCIEIHSVIYCGASLAICDDVTKLLDYLPQVQPTVLFAVPRIWNRIYDGVQKQVASRPALIQGVFANGMSARTKQKRGEQLGLAEKIALPLAEKLVFSKIRGRFGGRLRMAISGSAALSREVGEFIDNLGIQVYEGYGLTECSGASTVNYEGAVRIGSVGKVIPGQRIVIDTTAPGAENGEGEILLYGYGVMPGYYNLPEASAAAKTADGGIKTGDLGRLDADGFLYITGRTKELYKLENGKYVAPVPLEEKLQLSPFIAQCVVYGANRPYNVALIIPDKASLDAWAATQGMTPTSQGDAMLKDPRTLKLFQAELDKYGADFKGFDRVKGFILDSEELTTANGLLTPTLKLKRRNVLQKYEQRLKALYA